MRKTLIYPDGHKELVEAVPVHVRGGPGIEEHFDYCELCGDCLHCYGEDKCRDSADGEHWWAETVNENGLTEDQDELVTAFSNQIRTSADMASKFVVIKIDEARELLEICLRPKHIINGG